VSTATATSPLSEAEYQLIADRFRPILADVAADAARNDHERELLYPAVARLTEAGFGRLRIPAEHGGFGLTLTQFFRLLIEAGEADTNLPQLLRGHFGFFEGRLTTRDPAVYARYFPLAVAGQLVGNAQAERAETTGNSARITRRDGSWRLDGAKYYSTGTIYADWIWTMAQDGDDHVGVVLSATAPGVTRKDDWDGFGQKLTGSGTTLFDDVPIADEDVVRLATTSDGFAYITAFYQAVLLAALAGTARAIERDAVEFVRPRTRTFGVPGASAPREDPLVQRVVGKLSSLVYAAESTVLAAITTLDDAHARYLQAGDSDETGAFVAAEFAVFKAQQVVVNLVLEASTLLFEVGGASATSEQRRLDRHWRNARTIGSHNPLILRERAIGDYLLNGTIPTTPAQRRDASAADEGEATHKGDQATPATSLT
jgi:alkylation response protein AidB-like acyl-CoA dehydrogenase